VRGTEPESAWHGNSFHGFAGARAGAFRAVWVVGSPATRGHATIVAWARSSSCSLSHVVAAAIVFGVVTLIGDSEAGLAPAEPDGRAVPLPGTRQLTEGDLSALSFDTTMRGYRMEQVDQALRRAAYDLGTKTS